MTRIRGTVHEHLYTFMIISRWIILEWETFETRVVEKIRTHILCPITFIRKRAVYEIMCKNIVDANGLQLTIWHSLEKTSFACRITKARTHIHTHTHIIRLKKAKSKRSFFCFSTPSDTSLKDLLMFYCCRLHKFYTKHCSATVSIFYSSEWRVGQQHTECIVLFPREQWLRERAPVARYSTLLTCSPSPWHSFHTSGICNVVGRFYITCIWNSGVRRATDVSTSRWSSSFWPPRFTSRLEARVNFRLWIT